MCAFTQTKITYQKMTIVSKIFSLRLFSNFTTPKTSFEAPWNFRICNISFKILWKFSKAKNSYLYPKNKMGSLGISSEFNFETATMTPSFIKHNQC